MPLMEHGLTVEQATVINNTDVVDENIIQNLFLQHHTKMNVDFRETTHTIQAGYSSSIITHKKFLTIQCSSLSILALERFERFERARERVAFYSDSRQSCSAKY